MYFRFEDNEVVVGRLHFQYLVSFSLALTEVQPQGTSPATLFITNQTSRYAALFLNHSKKGSAFYEKRVHPVACGSWSFPATHGCQSAFLKQCHTARN